MSTHESYTRRGVSAMALVLALSLSGCEGSPPDADRQAAAQTGDLMREAAAQVGPPRITNWTELKLVNMLYELRDQEGLTTYTYIIDMNGRKHLLCESVGYGIPYAVQRTNPLRTVRSGSYGVEQLPQPEPNGLFMPDALSATWVMCNDGSGGISPVYVEPSILVSRFRMAE